MKNIKPIPTTPIPDGYYEIEWTLEGAILRDKINELIAALVNKEPDTVPGTEPPRIEELHPDDYAIGSPNGPRISWTLGERMIIDKLNDIIKKLDK